MALATLKYFPFYYKFDIEYEQISCTEVNEPSDSSQQAQRRKKKLDVTIYYYNVTHRLQKVAVQPIRTIFIEYLYKIFGVPSANYVYD